MSKPILIALMGLPRSGKSTVAKELSSRFGWPIVSRDAMRLAMHGHRYLAPMEGLIKSLDVYFIKSLFNAGHQYVICDETNYSKEARDHIKDGAWTTVFYPVMTDPLVCKSRAVATDQNDLLSVIDEMYDRYVELPDEEFRFNCEDNGKLIFKAGTYEAGQKYITI